VTRAPRDPSRRAEGGFVIIGVVMMVLALTIIGISLYGLSGYESQFFFTTVTERQALYRASGGIEIVKKLLTTPLGSPPEYNLANAGLALGREGIISAVAWQSDTSHTSGVIDWAQDVNIKVSVQVLGETRTVQGSYHATNPRSPYHELFTTSNLIRYGDPGDDLSNRAPLVVRGGNWQNIPPSDSTWKQSVDLGSGFQTIVNQAPAPASAEFISEHLGGWMRAAEARPSGTSAARRATRRP
jgi:hypothetical protein